MVKGQSQTAGLSAQYHLTPLHESCKTGSVDALRKYMTPIYFQITVKGQGQTAGL